jgi:hypothetical protein
MRSWWWRWLPGWRKQWRLEERRSEALSSISDARSRIERMAQRPRNGDDTLDSAFVARLLGRLAESEERAEKAFDTDELDRLINEAELQGLFSSYICPLAEIEDEGNLVIDLIEEWGIPKGTVKRLRDSLGKKIKVAADPEGARGALHALFQERDSWESYTDEYEDTMRWYTYWLFGAALILPPLAVAAFHFAFRFSPLLFLGLVFAGAAGSCVSVMAKMPALDVSLSGELDAYGRRMMSRIGIGVVASLIGCAFLAWGVLPVSIQNQTFADALGACATSPAGCTAIKTLILLGVPMLLGFSERSLTSFEQSVFGRSPKG